MRVFEPKQQGSLQSPKIFASKACLTFQYMSRSTRELTLDGSRMLVYVKDSENKQLLPVNDKLLYSAYKKWNTMMIDLNIRHGFTKVSLLRLVCV